MHIELSSAELTSTLQVPLDSANDRHHADGNGG
jgi:hypothetical protein